MKILVTGGPVHAHLDKVKIITNRFKGGLMVSLVKTLHGKGHNVTYLTSKHTKPDTFHLPLLTHNGIDDYIQQVLELAPQFDAVVLGAAVANLIPKDPYKGKFPSHNYKVGDTINIPFTIAPRVIDQITKVAPKTQLFGFKLLSEVSEEELIGAALDIVHESRATTVFANLAEDLDSIWAVTKEGCAHPMDRWMMGDFIHDRLQDQYYRTKVVQEHNFDETVVQSALEKCKSLAQTHKDKFNKTYGSNDYVFGSIAVKINGTDAFVTTARGKKELEDWCIVLGVDHETKIVTVVDKKATPNAPLLENIFSCNSGTTQILHYHQTGVGYNILPYYPAGTVRDSIRNQNGNFEIDGHGVYEPS